MTYTIQIKKGQLDVEKALRNMDYDVVKFESELKMLADHQPPRTRKKLLRQYAEYMRGCGFKLSVRGIGKTPVSASKPTPKTESVAEIKPETTVKPEIPQETTPKTVIAEVAAQMTEQKEKIPEPVPEITPQTESSPKVAEVENTENKEPEIASPTIVAEAEFSVSDANLLKKLFESIHRVTDEPVFNMTSDALCIRQMDPSRTAMIDYKIGKEYFETYHVKTPGKYCFNIEEALKVAFGKLKKDTPVTVKINGGIYKEGALFKEHIAFIFHEGRTRERSFPLLESSDEDVPTPKISFNVKAKVVAKNWTEDLEDLAKVSDHMTITATNDKLTVKAEGDIARGENSYPKGSDELLDLEAREDSKAVYSLTYLNDVLKIDPAFCDLAAVEFASDMPMRLTMQTKFGELYSYLAPRISCD